MPLPLGVVGSEGKQLDNDFVEKIYKANAIIRPWNISIDGQGSMYTTDQTTLTKQYYNGVLDYSNFCIPNNVSTTMFQSSTVDNNGNTYAAGRDGNYVMVSKFDTFGELLWTKSYQVDTVNSGGVGNSENAMSITVCSLGYIYIAALWYAFSPFTNNGILVLKFDQNGNSLWGRRVTNDISDSLVKGIAVDNTTGLWSLLFMNRSGSSTFHRPITWIGQTTNGNVNCYTVPQIRIDADYYGDNCVVMDTNGNSYIIGQLIQTYPTPVEPVVYKLNSSGGIIWSKKLVVSFPGQISPEQYRPISFTLSPDGNFFYILGYVQLSGSSSYITFTKTDLNLNIIFCTGMQSNYGLKIPTDIAVSPIKNFMSATSYIDGGSTTTGLVFKLPADGTKLGVTTWAGETYTYVAPTSAVFANSTAFTMYTVAFAGESVALTQTTSRTVTITPTGYQLTLASIN